MSGKKWILLVAGSKDWANYRHQANVCGLYQIIKKHGIPDEQIVVMMYDDIAKNSKNPCSDPNGEIVSVVDDSNVYLNVPKDYNGEDVTPENFLAALRGDKIYTNKKVIESGPNDNIYVYMSGLGKEDETFQEGPFQFLEKTLSPDALNETLQSMHAENKFSKMVIFMECSYSARMFKDLPDDINVWALASCHKDVPLCPSDFNDKMDIFLSDKFSSAWLKDLSKADFTTTTFKHITETRQSKYLEENPVGPCPCPCQFGNTDYINCCLSEFLQQ